MRTFIKPNHEYLVYRGRYDDTDREAPVFGFPYSGIAITFEGPELTLHLKNKHYEKDNYIGVMIDQQQAKYKLENSEEEQVLLLASGLEEVRHEAFVFKRTDLSNELVFLGFDLGERGKILMPRKEPRRLIELIGDSITAGECVESKKASREEIGEEEAAATTNPYYSYGAIMGRLLHCRVNLVSQSGIAMQDGLGLFGGEHRIGMQTLYPMASYNMKDKTGALWNENRSLPNVIIVSLGQFDQYPDDFMKKDFIGERAKRWKENYSKFLMDLRKKYPKTVIVLATSTCRHSPKWDRAIGQICANMGDSKIIHFLYNENGRNSDGFVNVAQSEQMALELSGMLKTLENNAEF